jgi:hypothetical protein
MYINITFLAVFVGVKFDPLYSRKNIAWEFYRVQYKRRFGPKRKEVIRGWRKLYNEDLRHY